jgi:GGDEF domain-containing protein
LREQAIRDPLTGLFNRRFMEESMNNELRARAVAIQISV